mgnify:CR=1 FL=1
MITINIGMILSILLKILTGLILWVIVGLIAVVCEVRWGFPFGHGFSFSGELRVRIVKECLNKNRLKYVFLGPLGLLGYSLSGLIAFIIVTIGYLGFLFGTIIDLFFNGFRLKGPRE